MKNNNVSLRMCKWTIVTRTIEGLCAKRAYIALWADFYPLQDRDNLWQTDPPRHEKHHRITAPADPRFVFEKELTAVCKRTQFSKQHLWSESFKGGFQLDANLNSYF